MSRNHTKLRLVKLFFFYYYIFQCSCKDFKYNIETISLLIHLQKFMSPTTHVVYVFVQLCFNSCFPKIIFLRIFHKEKVRT